MRGGFHVVAYARALEVLTGVDVKKLLPIPDLSNKAITETRKYEKMGLHRKLYTFSEDDYRQAGLIMEGGTHPDDGQPLEMVIGGIEGPKAPDLAEEPQLNAPGSDDWDPQMFADIAKKMGIKIGA